MEIHENRKRLTVFLFLGGALSENVFSPKGAGQRTPKNGLGARVVMFERKSLFSQRVSYFIVLVGAKGVISFLRNM